MRHLEMAIFGIRTRTSGDSVAEEAVKQFPVVPPASSVSAAWGRPPPPTYQHAVPNVQNQFLVLVDMFLPFT